MAEEKKLPNPERYRYGKVGYQFLQGKDINSAGKCLEKLALDMNVPEENKPFLIWNATSGDPKMREYGLVKGLEIALGKYEEEMGNFTISQMFERYSPEFDKYLVEEEKEKAKSVFEKLGDNTYASIMKKVQVLNVDRAISKEDRESSKELKERAEKEYSKYADIVETIQEFEGLRLGKLMNPIQEDSIKSNAKERFKVEKKEGEK